jgi:hypothetical protein
VTLTSYSLGRGTPELRGGRHHRLAENAKATLEETASQVLGESPSVPVNSRVVEATRQGS